MTASTPLARITSRAALRSLISRSRAVSRSDQCAATPLTPSVPGSGWAVRWASSLTALSPFGSYLQADEHRVGVRQIPDDLAHRLGQAAHQRRDRDDLIAPREPRVLHQVDQLDVVAPG